MLSELSNIPYGVYWFDYETGGLPLKWMLFQAGYDKRCDHRYRIVRKYCLRHFNEPLTVDDLAAEAGLSRYHFSRKFKELTEISPAGYLTRLRMERAQALFSEGRAVKEVTSLSGYSDPSYFCKVFRKHFGHSPGQHRS